MLIHAKDMDFTKAFLLCFRCFCPPLQFLALLVRRFVLDPPPGLTPEEEEDWRKRKLIPLRLRVFNVLKSWLETYFIPEEDSVVLPDMRAFITTHIEATMPSVATRLLRLLNRRVEMGQQRLEVVAGSSVDASVQLSPRLMRTNQNSHQHGSSYSGSTSLKLPRSVTDLDPTEVANQLTLMDSRLFRAITPRELIGQEFAKKENSLAVNVRAMSTLSTQVTTWVTESILFEQDIKKRAALIKYFVKVGDRCLTLQNYNSVFAIFSALNSSSIQRLKHTWKLVSNRTMMTFATLQRACDYTRNFAAYRARLKQAMPPCLPFMGVYLTDLTFIEDGNAKLKRCTTATHVMINFSKYLKTVELLNEIQRFQVEPYPMNEVQHVRACLEYWLENTKTGGDQEELYQLSLKVEPREG
jgi:son of sevenless-like protein